MLSLSTEDVAEHWEQVSPELGQLFASIERAEDWALDNHPDIAERLQSFGLRLSDTAAAAKLADADRNDLLFFLVYISSSKAFRIVQWLDERHAGLGSRLLGVLLQQDSNGVFSNVLDPMLAGTLVQRLQVVQNTPFFQRLLAPEFLGSLSKAITNYHQERSERDE